MVPFYCMGTSSHEREKVSFFFFFYAQKQKKGEMCFAGVDFTGARFLFGSGKLGNFLGARRPST